MDSHEDPSRLPEEMPDENALEKNLDQVPSTTATPLSDVQENAIVDAESHGVSTKPEVRKNISNIKVCGVRSHGT